MRSLLTFSVLVVAACASPPPTCAASEAAFDICSDNQVFECPVGSTEALAEKQAIEDACAESADPTGCIFDAEFEQFPTTLKADCAGAGQVVHLSRLAESQQE